MPRYRSASEYQELGRQYYKAKEYQKALDAFTEALDAETSINIGVLDNRAATFEKLGNLKSALSDARQMIKNAERDVRGYLRCGKILQLMKKPEVALEIYQRGMRKCPVDNAHFKLLQGVNDKLNRQLSPPSAADPFKMLPPELVEIVMGYVSFADIVRCLRVCRHWKHFLASLSRLWTTIDFSEAKRTVRPRFVSNCINWSDHKIRTAILYQARDPNIMRSLATTCKQLHTLHVIGSDLLGESIIETAMMARNLKVIKLERAHPSVLGICTLDTIVQILRHRPTLEVIEISEMISSRSRADWTIELPNLRSFTVKGSEIWGHLNVSDLIARAPNLFELRITDNQYGTTPPFTPLSAVDVSILSKLRTLELKTNSQAFPVLPPSIQVLRLKAIKFRFPEETSVDLPNLVELGVPVRTCDGDDDGRRLLLKSSKDDAGNAIPNVTPIKVLRIYSGYYLSLEDLNELFTNPRLGELEEFMLTDSNLTDTALKHLAEHFPRLRRVDLSKCSSISGVLVKRLVSQLRDLESLKLDGCHHISSDAVEWARSQGVSVSFKPPNVLSGKRVWTSF